MYTINDLIDYVNNHLIYSTLKIKEPSIYLKKVFEQVEEKNINYIMERLYKRNFGVVISDKYCFDPSQKQIFFPLNKNSDIIAILHEFGHSFDFIKIEDKTSTRSRSGTTQISIAMSNSFVLSNGMTLDDTIKKEIKETGQKIYEDLMGEYDKIVSSIITQEELDVYNSYDSLKEQYMELKKRVRKRSPYLFIRDKNYYNNDDVNIMVNYLDLSKFKDKNEALNVLKQVKSLEEKVYGNKEYSIIVNKIYKSELYIKFINDNSIVLDALGRKYNLKNKVPTHTVGYYKKSGTLGSEFFANCFAQKMLNEEAGYVIKYLPNSYKAFLELFDII